jgi:PAS domain-containing protein
MAAYALFSSCTVTFKPLADWNAALLVLITQCRQSRLFEVLSVLRSSSIDRDAVHITTGAPIAPIEMLSRHPLISSACNRFQPGAGRPLEGRNEPTVTSLTVLSNPWRLENTCEGTCRMGPWRLNSDSMVGTMLSEASRARGPAESPDPHGVTDATPALVVCAFTDGSAEIINQSWRKYTGRSLEDWGKLGRPSVVRPQDLPQFTVEWDLARSEKEARVRRADGEFSGFQAYMDIWSVIDMVPAFVWRASPRRPH